MEKFYEQQIKMFKLKDVLGILLSIIWTFSISYFYGLIVAISPLVYINIFITIGFGMFIGVGLKMLFKIFLITNKKEAIITAMACGFLGSYFSWVGYLLYFTPDVVSMDAYFVNFLLVFRPNIVFQIISDINVTGMWEIFGVPFNGWILTIIWIAETVMIVVVPTLFIHKQPIAPFSAQMNKWYRKYVLNKDFESIALQQIFRTELMANCIPTIEGLGKGIATHFARVSVYYLADEFEQYISVENVSKDSTGKSEEITNVIHLLVISKSDAEILIKNFHGKKAFFFDY